MRLGDIIAGKGKLREIKIDGKDGFCHTFKELSDHIVCQDGTELSVQASHTHYCAPRTDHGPYFRVEVGYPTVAPPETWAEYADGEYPSDVYAYVPVEIVREFVQSHGGES